MPIYEYACPKCEKTFEEWLKNAKDAEESQACPHCGTASGRVISHTSFLLKGEGWYVSEYGYKKGVKEGEASESPQTPDATQAAPANSESAASTATEPTTPKLAPSTPPPAVSASSTSSVSSGSGASSQSSTSSAA